MGLSELDRELQDLPIEAAEECLDLRFEQLLTDGENGFSMEDTALVIEKFGTRYPALEHIAEKAVEKLIEETGSSPTSEAVMFFKLGLYFSPLVVQEIIDRESFQKMME